MKVRLTVSFLSIFFLWSTLLDSNYAASLSKTREIKIASNTFCITLSLDENYFPKKLSNLTHVVLPRFTIADFHIWYEGCHKIVASIVRSEKFFLLFRVLRN